MLLGWERKETNCFIGYPKNGHEKKYLLNHVYCWKGDNTVMVSPKGNSMKNK